MRWVASVLLCWAVSWAALAEKKFALESALPESLGAGWKMKEAVKTYDKDTLFEYIDGEAELYFPYGFEKLASAQYQIGEDGQTALTVDVYLMGSLLDAFGVYSSFRRADAELIAIGGEGFVNDSQAMFYQGRHFVAIEVSGAARLDKDLFRDAAQSIARRLPGGKDRPKELEWIALEDAEPKTQKYFAQGPFGLAFLPPALVVDATRDAPPVRVFVGIAKDVDAAAQALDAYAEHAIGSGAQPKTVHMPWGRRVTANDPLYKGFALEQCGRYVLGAINLPDPDQAAVLDRLRARVKP